MNPMNTITDDDILMAMSIYGGSFVKALAAATYQADPANRTKLKAAFPDIWRDYADLVKVHFDREAAK